MKKLLLFTFAAALTFTLSADILKEWTFKNNRDLMGDRMSFYAAKGSKITKNPSKEKTPDGKSVIEISLPEIAADSPRHAIQVHCLYRNALEKGKKYRLQFQYKGSVNGEIGLIIAQSGAPYKAVAKGTSKVLAVTPEWQTCTIDFTAENVDGKNFAMPRFMLASYPVGGKLFIGAVTLSDVPKNIPLALNQKWEMKTEDGKIQTVSLDKDTLVLNTKKKIILTNRFTSSEAGFMQVGMAADWWFTASVNGKKVYSTEPRGNQSHEFKPSDHIFNFPVKRGENVLTVLVRPGSQGFRFVCGAVPYTADPDASRRLFVVKESEKYRPIDDKRLLVKLGTALDMSEVNGKRVPAGTYGRVIVNAKGKLAFEKKPEQAVRFIGMNYSPSYWRLNAHKWTKQDIERFADACAAQGYNMIRVHYPCRYLLGFKIHNRPHRSIKEAGLPQRAEDIEFDKGNVDRFDYIIKCFKDRGIYLNIDLMNRPGFSMAYKEGPDELFKVDLFFNQAYRKHWEVAVKYLMNRVNPYTGVKMKDEPAVAFVNYFNEQDFLLGNALTLKKIQSPFRSWLKNKYKTEDALRKAWNQPKITFATATLNEKVIQKGDTASKDCGDFLISTMQEMTTWFTKQLREAGYPGLFNHWDMIMRTMEMPARALVPAIAQHTYFAHQNPIPTRNLVKKDKGALFMGGFGNDMTVEQSSSLNSSYFRAAAAVRFFDRPYMITEYSHCSFNKYRHERGLYFGSYASLQGWDDLTPHADTVSLATDPLWTFEHGRDPISKASETVAVLTYLRGDVKEASGSVGLLLKDKNMFPKNYLAAISDDYAKLAMLTKIGIVYNDVKPLMKVGTFKPAMMLEPKQFSKLSVTTWYVSADNRDGNTFPYLLNKLKQNNLLPSGNRTDWSKRIYQSETGEITLDAKKLTMNVVTPRLEGVILKSGQTADLPHISVKNISVPASFVAASLNRDENLNNAKRVLLTVATNAFNTDMTFENASLFCCVNPGKLPILIESIKCDVTLKTAQTVQPKVYALHMDGTRFAEIPCTLKDGKLNIKLDTSKLKYGTPYFEIVY